MKEMQDLFNRSDELEKEYEKYFKVDFPDRIIGWWDPVHILHDLEGLKEGVKAKEKDIRQAIATNIQIEEIPEEVWQNIVF